MRASRFASQRGFTLVEVMAAALVLVVGILGVLAMVDTANQTTVRTRAREAATSLARQLIEDTHDIPYAQLSASGINADLQSHAGLESVPGSSIYTIKRRGFTYSIDTGVCTVDDPRDGIGPHTSSNFCTAGASGSNPNSNAPAGSGDDANGNRIDASFSASVGASVTWSSCSTLPTTQAAQSSGSLASILGSAAAAQASSDAAATSCAGGGPATAADVSPDDYKAVAVEVRWGTHNVRQTTLIANPGNSAGPAVVALTPSGGTTVGSGTSSVAFTATTNLTPAAVTWSRDGDPQGDASGSGTTWTFSWNLGPETDVNGGALNSATVLDGTYIIGATAFDQFGTSGPGRTVTMMINRSVPRQVTGVAAGRNGSVVEIQWQPNPERDVIGYQAFRGAPGSGTQVCALTQATTCQDPSPPAGTLSYYVVAYDRDGSGAQRAGTASPPVTVTTTNRPPSPPTSLVASTSSGSTILRWTASPGDPDTGDSVAFYRIYRDGSAYANRYDRTGDGATVTYTDTRTGGVSHSYYVTAVDTNLAESTLLGPVTR